MECTSELAELQAADAGCGPEPEPTSRTSISTAPSGLCDCCSIEVVPDKDPLCAIAEVKEQCAFTCGGMGVDKMMLTEKIAIRKYKAENIDGGASTETSFCSSSARSTTGRHPVGRRLFDAAPAAPAKCEDAAVDVVAALAAELSLSYGSCASCARRASATSPSSRSTAPPRAARARTSSARTWRTRKVTELTRSCRASS